jgi:hypothetical protein
VKARVRQGGHVRGWSRHGGVKGPGRGGGEGRDEAKRNAGDLVGGGGAETAWCRGHLRWRR